MLDDNINIGVPEDTDIDAWEFCLISMGTYLDLFGTVIGDNYAVVGLFSVDENDPNTAVDESGGLDPNTVYVSNLIGTRAALATYAADIDALTVPEPATLSLLVLGGLALIRRR